MAETEVETRTSPRFKRLTKPVEGVKEKLEQPVSKFLSDKWMWIYLITLAAVALILLFLYMYKYKASAYTSTESPTWVPNKWVTGIILIAVFFLYFVGSYRLDRAVQGNPVEKLRLWIFRITYFVQIALVLIIGWLAMYSQKFQWCFWLSFLLPIVLAVQMFFAWFVDKLSFFLLVPALVIEIIMIYAFYKWWKLN